MVKQTPLRFGIKTSPQQTSYEAMLKVWQEADAEPQIEHGWLFDHLMPLSENPADPCLDGWSVLTALAAVTTRLRLGIMVSSNTFRHPGVLAKMGAAVDHISKGRLDFGIGAGWNEREHDAYGLELYQTGERIHRMGEACEVIRRLWTESAVTFEGKYYQLKDAYCEPKPVQKPYPPFVIGGGGEKLTLRYVARYADIWNVPGGKVEDLKRKSEILDQHCAAVGRDPAAITRSVQYVVSAGKLIEAREELQRFIDSGFTHLILVIRPPFPDRIVRQLVTEIIEPLQGRYQ